MNKHSTCPCLMKSDLQNSATPLAFLDENYSVPGIMKNPDGLSRSELKCACCLFGTALQNIPRKPPPGKQVKRKNILKRLLSCFFCTFAIK